MATISFTRKIEISREQYEKMLKSTPTKEFYDAMEKFKKENSIKYEIGSERIREILGDFGRE